MKFYVFYGIFWENYIRIGFFKEFMNDITKKGLAIVLSRLRDKKGKKVSFEQYSTDSEIASSVLWFMFMKDKKRIKKVMDLGCGNGIFGLGCLLLGSEKVYFVDKDKEMIEIAKKNYKELKNKGLVNGRGVFINKDVRELGKGFIKAKIGVVIENPPFGTKKRNEDMVFLSKAFKISDVVYSFHKTSTKDFVFRFANNKGFVVSDVMDFRMVIKKEFSFHKKPRKFIEVSCFRFEKIKN